jgi:hypothetical protein
MKGARRRVRVVICGVMCGTLATAPACGATEAESVLTSIRREDCAQPAADVAAAFNAKDLGVQECRALPGWRLLLVASDANTWLELRGPGVTWSAEQAIVYESPIGLFPSVDGAGVVEWRRPPNGEPTALIFRVTAQDRENPTAHRSQLFVARIESSRACLLGRVATNEEARALADSGTACY